MEQTNEYLARKFVTESFYHMVGHYNDKSFSRYMKINWKIKSYGMIDDAELSPENDQKHFRKVQHEIDNYISEEERNCITVIYAKSTNASDAVYGLATIGAVCDQGTFTLIDKYKRLIQDQNNAGVAQAAVTGYVTAHEMGHLLNMEHNCDGDCNAGLLLDAFVRAPLRGIFKLTNIMQLQQKIKDWDYGGRPFCLIDKWQKEQEAKKAREKAKKENMEREDDDDYYKTRHHRRVRSRRRKHAGGRKKQGKGGAGKEPREDDDEEYYDDDDDDGGGARGLGMDCRAAGLNAADWTPVLAAAFLAIK